MSEVSYYVMGPNRLRLFAALALACASAAVGFGTACGIGAFTADGVFVLGAVLAVGGVAIGGGLTLIAVAVLGERIATRPLALAPAAAHSSHVPGRAQPA